MDRVVTCQIQNAKIAKTSVKEAILPLSPFYHLFQFIAVTSGGADGIDELMIITGRVVAPAQKFPVFVCAAHHLVVVLHNQVFGQLVPALHHRVLQGQFLALNIASIQVGECMF